MDFKSFAVKSVMMSFFVMVTCICVAMAILGIFFVPDARFGYEVLFYPLIFGAATTLPSLVNYSKRELSIREAALRKLFQFILIEFIVLFIVYYSSNGMLTGELAITLALSVFLIFGVVHLVLWINDRKTAEAFNLALKDMQQHIEHTR